MIFKTFLLFFLIAIPAFAEKVIYLDYEEVPDRVIKGQVFSITVKTLSTVQNFSNITYKFTDHRGISILNKSPYRKKRGKFYYDTFSLYVTSSIAKLPDIEASLVADRSYDSTTIKGGQLNIITLNPPKNFSNVIANSFTLQNYKTTSYDKKHNIIVFSAVANNSIIGSMKFNNVFKQGQESINPPRITYFVVIDKKYNKFSFSYFNLRKNKYVDIDIPVIVDDDSVTTQSDLKPKNQTHEKIKFYIALAIALLIVLIALWTKRYIVLVLIIIPAGAVYFIATPSKEICINKGAEIQLLPIDNGTIFEVTKQQIFLLQEGNVQNYIKVRLENEKIGWVKYEDTCSN